MSLRPREYSKPSTLATLIGQVVDAFRDMGDGTPIMVGKQYLEHGAGSAPRVVIVPEARGRVSAPIRMGRACSVEHGCVVYVRGPETGDDITRFDAAYALGDRVLDCVATAGAGRISWNEYSDGSPVDVDFLGAEVVFAFTFKREVHHDAARWSLPAPAQDSASPVPYLPPGEAADDVQIEVTVTPPAE